MMRQCPMMPEQHSKLHRTQSTVNKKYSIHLFGGFCKLNKSAKCLSSGIWEKNYECLSFGISGN
jgi:hypothetical protein